MVVTVAIVRAHAMAPADTLASAAYSLAAVATALVGTVGGIVLWGLARRRATRRQERLFQRNKVEADAALADLATSRMRAFVSAGQVRALLDGSADGIALLDNDLRLTSWNQRFVGGAGVEEAVLQEGLPLDQLLRLQANAGLFGPLADIEAEVSRRVAFLRAADAAPGLTQLGPDGTAIAVRADRIPEIGLALHLGGLAHWQPVPRSVPQQDPDDIEPDADSTPTEATPIKEKTATIEW
jgi:PAS domain-containing protein